MRWAAAPARSRPGRISMREAGVEPARLAALEPKSSASASFATLACRRAPGGFDKSSYRARVGSGFRASILVSPIEALDASRGTPRRSGSRSPCQSAWKWKPTQRQSFPVSPNGPESRRLRSGLLWVSRSAGADAGTAVTFIEALDASRGTPRRSGSRSPCQSAWKRKPTQRQSFPVSPNGQESRRWRSGLVLGVTARQGPRLREPPGSDPGCLRRLPSGAARLPEADREPCRRPPRPPRCRTGFLDSRSG